MERMELPEQMRSTFMLVKLVDGAIHPLQGESNVWVLIGERELKLFAYVMKGKKACLCPWPFNVLGSSVAYRHPE